MEIKGRITKAIGASWIIVGCAVAFIVLTIILLVVLLYFGFSQFFA